MFSRRRAFLAVGSALVLPVGLQACGGAGAPGSVPPVETLMLQHGVLRRVLAVYRLAALRLRINPAVVDGAALEAATDLFRVYGEDYHERALEEAFVFPALQKAGGALAGLVATAREQHERGRVLTAFVHDRCTGAQVAASQAEAVARALESMADMYEAHAAFEDTVLYPAWEKTLTSLQLHDMAQRFDGIQRNSFKTETLASALAQVSGIEQRLGAKDLSTYTAAAPSDMPPGVSDQKAAENQDAPPPNGHPPGPGRAAPRAHRTRRRSRAKH